MHVLQGFFTARDVVAFLALLDVEKGIARYWGDGKTPIDWTTYEDAARFTAGAALDDLPAPEHLFVAGDRLDVLTRGVFGGQALLGATHNARYPEIAAETVAAAVARGAV